MSLVAGLLRPRLFSSKLSKLKVTEKYSGSATPVNSLSQVSLTPVKNLLPALTFFPGVVDTGQK